MQCSAPFPRARFFNAGRRGALLIRGRNKKDCYPYAIPGLRRSTPRQRGALCVETLLKARRAALRPGHTLCRPSSVSSVVPGSKVPLPHFVSKGELRLISNIIAVCVHCVEKRRTLAQKFTKRSVRACARRLGKRSGNPFRPGTAISCGNWKGRRRRATRGVQGPPDGADSGLDRGHVSAVGSDVRGNAPRCD